MYVPGAAGIQFVRVLLDDGVVRKERLPEATRGIGLRLVLKVVVEAGLA
jgi:hypothetical protein